MKKLILVGRSEAGKTTLRQALKGEKIHYHKTQYVNRFDAIIDTPGEYIQSKNLAAGLAMYTFEADVVGILMSAIEPYSLLSPACTPVCNREVIGIVTKINHPNARVDMAEMWLRLCGCRNIFFVDSKTGEGVWKILEYLREPGDVMPWEEDGNALENDIEVPETEINRTNSKKETE